ncbi:Membrane protein involved in the export of O-antigen and teichoic acid [Ruminococcus albus]|uniref:Membrane protein involved in the export of O-antigen and teichoic acid n=1 Tax=Ruminococcus albus TaxID=1264 RepID=A0A1H7KQJ8_RUMAL|nr:Membrane protein involved in the export of O-antigen and teichoic acid [Ruminococcus albus]
MIRVAIKESSRTKNSVKNIFASLGGQLLVIVLRFVTRTVFIHTLGTEYLGINGLFSEILSMLSLTELGIDTAINFQMYKPLAEHDDKRVRVLMKFYKQAYRIIGLVIFLLGLCLIPVLRFLIKDYDSLEGLGINAVLIFILYLLQSVSSYLFFAYRSTIMKANQKKYILDIAGYAIMLATNISQILVLVYLRNFVIYTATVILFNIIQNVINAVIVQKYYPQFFIKEEESLSKAEVQSLFKDCGALFVYKINAVVLKATDNTILSTFIGLKIVGLYSNYLLFYSICKNMLSMLYTSVKASMGNLFAVSDDQKKYLFFEIMNYLTVILYGTAGIGIAVCANEFISLWIGTEYTIKQPFPILIGIELIFNGLKNNLGQIRNISGAFRQMWFRPVLGIIVNLGVSIILVNICGIYGVIIGTISADLLTNFMVDPGVIHKYSLNNYKPVSNYYIKNIKYFIILVTVGIIDYLLCKFLVVNIAWLSLIVHVLIVASTVPVTFLLLYRNSNEYDYLIGIVRKIFNKRKSCNS